MIPGQREVSIPGLVRIKPGALDRVGIYVRRADYRTVALIHSEDLPVTLIDRLQAGLDREGIVLAHVRAACEASCEEARAIAAELSCPGLSAFWVSVAVKRSTRQCVFRLQSSFGWPESAIWFRN